MITTALTVQNTSPPSAESIAMHPNRVVICRHDAGSIDRFTVYLRLSVNGFGRATWFLYLYSVGQRGNNDARCRRSQDRDIARLVAAAGSVGR